MSEAQLQLVRNVRDGTETFWRSGTSGGKTAGGAALGVALARGLPELGGEPMPPVAIPNVGWVVTQSYKQQVDASQKAYAKWLGDWPHDVSYVAGRSKGYWETIYVATALCKHDTGKNCETCSRIVFHCAESDSAIGGRIDWAHGDEPPTQQVWREVRGRRTAGRPFYKFITATPLDLAQCGWLQDDFAGSLAYCSKYVSDAPADIYGSALNGRAEVRSTIYDNRALSSEDVAAFLRDFQGDPYLQARIRGEYVDASGSSPFDIGILDRWAARCKDGLMQRMAIETEIDRPDGRQREHVSVEVETWWEREADEKYLLIADPASGVKSKTHDPAGLCVFARRRPRLVARYNGYLAPYGLGKLAGILGEKYGKALIDVDMGGGYGGAFLGGLGRYSNISRDTDPDKPGFVNQRLGFRLTSANRGEVIGAIQQALTEDSIIILSADMIQCLRNIVLVLTPSGMSRYEAKAGRKDEDFIVLGRALFLMGTRPCKLPRHESMSARLRRGLGIRAPRPSESRLAWS